MPSAVTSMPTLPDRVARERGRARPITFDLTHLDHRSRYCAPTGIERVDLAFGEHFAFSSQRSVRALHYGVRRPAVLHQSELQSLVGHVRLRWGLDVPADRDPAYVSLLGWLAGTGAAHPPRLAPEEGGDEDLWPNVVSALRRRALPYVKSGPAALPRGSIYLNVAQHAFENEVYFRWLAERRDLQRVFFVHDLLPLDYPEFWPGGHETRFRQRLERILIHASAIITSSNEVKRRIEREYAGRGLPSVPVLALPFAPRRPVFGGASPAPRRPTDPFFLMIGTLEPRKNHLFVLNVWRQLAELMERPPRLVIAGKRSWMSETILGTIERSPSLKPHVCAVYGLGDDALRQLLGSARALLMPSFAEGFGIPVIEALNAGIPVVASDIPIFHEVTKGAGVFLGPVDGPAWVRTVRALCCEADFHGAASSSARAFRTHTTHDYFQDVEDFLTDLPAAA